MPEVNLTSLVALAQLWGVEPANRQFLLSLLATQMGMRTTWGRPLITTIACDAAASGSSNL